jgi:hypothetical protein
MLLKPVFIIAIVAVAMIGVMVPSGFADHNGIKIEPNWKSKLEIKIVNFSIDRLHENYQKYRFNIEYKIFNPNPSDVRIHKLNNQLFEINSSNSKFVCEGYNTSGSINYILDSNHSVTMDLGCTITFKELYDNHPEVWYSLEENTSTWKVLGTLQYDQFGAWDPKTAFSGDYPFEFLLTGPIPKNLPPLTSEIKDEPEYSSSQSEIDNKMNAISEYGDQHITWDGAPNAKQTNSELIIVDDSMCGRGTMIENGKCVAVISTEEGGGCLIATATYGSEMALEVQQLRELRDNQLLQTEYGTTFMTTFNDIYYSFSPTIADYERENPYFKEAVKLAITPMISSLSLMENAESESEVLSIGISVIMLNLGMYLGVPAVVIVGIKRRF